MRDAKKIQSPEGRPRIVQLDLLRAVAILLVIGRHVFQANSMGASRATTDVFWRLVGALERGGWVGVDLFFVLSGFLVSGLLFEEHRLTGAMSPKRFLVRRAFKIYPAFYVLIATTMGVVSLRDRAPSLSELLASGLFFQNYTHSSVVWGLWTGQLWSLCVEEHFYLTLPALLWWLGRRPEGLRHVTTIAVVIAVACLAARLAAAPEFFAIRTHERLDSLFAGVAVAYWFHHRREQFLGFCQRFRWALTLSGGLALAPPFFFELRTTPFLTTYGYSLFYLGGASVLSGLLAFDVGHGRLTRGLAFVGRHSYSIYLWHWPVRLALFSFATRSPLELIVIYVGATLLVGIGMAKLVEFPALALRERFSPPPSSSGVERANNDARARAA